MFYKYPRLQGQSGVEYYQYVSCISLNRLAVWEFKQPNENLQNLTKHPWQQHCLHLLSDFPAQFSFLSPCRPVPGLFHRIYTGLSARPRCVKWEDLTPHISLVIFPSRADHHFISLLRLYCLHFSFLLYFVLNQNVRFQQPN